MAITISKAEIKKKEGIVILPLKEYQNLVRRAIPNLVDRGIEESLEDFKQGRSYGPFSHEEGIRFLHEYVRKHKSRNKK